METIAQIYARSGALIDPHTAVAVAAAQAEIVVQGSGTPMIALGCAHPAKFPDAVERATGLRPNLPPSMAELLERPERIVVLPNELGAVSRFIRSRARRAGAAA